MYFSVFENIMIDITTAVCHAWGA